MRRIIIIPIVFALTVSLGSVFILGLVIGDSGFKTNENLVDGVFSRLNQPGNFSIELAEKELWHVSSSTDAEGTNLTVTIDGRPVAYLGASQWTEETYRYTYSWQMEQPFAGSSGLDFDLGIPQTGYGRRWSFNISIEGNGTTGLQITRIMSLSIWDPFINNLLFGLDIFTMASVGIFLVQVAFEVRRRRKREQQPA
jgi:hypothetical protein